MELWKDIPSYEGLYEASNKGRIRSKEGKTTSSARFAKRIWKQRIMKQKFKKQKTEGVMLWLPYGKTELLTIISYHV